MGYSTSGGTKGLGTITSPFTPKADLQQILTLLGEVGNLRVVTTTQRDALTGAKLYEGALIYNTTTDRVEFYDSGWKPYIRAVLDVVTFAGIYSAGTPTPRLVLIGGRYSLDGVATSSSATFVAGTSYTLGSIPSAKAPATVQKFALTANATAVASLTVDVTGAITFVLNTGFTGVLALSLAGASWPDKGP